jgi:hypothetical protein
MSAPTDGANRPPGLREGAMSDAGTLILIALALGVVLFVVSVVIESHHYRDR